MTVKVGFFISVHTTYSRRKIFDFIKENKVVINGTICTSYSQDIHPNKDTVLVEKVALPKGLPFYYYKLNKPEGVISTLKDPKKRKDLTHYVEKLAPGTMPVGRLDRKTSGLLLLTNDGHFAQRILHPKFKLPKTYRVTLNHVLTKAHLKRLLEGIILEDGPVQFESIAQIASKRYDAVITEGRNHIIRRSFMFLGYSVEKLKRLSIGPIVLSKLPKGHAVKLTTSEIKAIKKFTDVEEKLPPNP